MATDLDSMGKLRGKIELTLHSYHATRLWYGRGVSTGKPQIIGCRQFLLLAGRIQQSAARDDPYADYWMLRIDERADKAKEALDERQADVKHLLHAIPPELSIAENINQQPLVTPVYTGGPQGWQAVMLLIGFDRLVRDVLMLQHIAMMSRDTGAAAIESVRKRLLGLFSEPKRYPGHSGSTRDDHAANNARARDAVAKYGELPEDVLRGERRSPWAPVIRQRSGSDALEQQSGPVTAQVEGGSVATGNGTDDFTADS